MRSSDSGHPVTLLEWVLAGAIVVMLFILLPPRIKGVQAGWMDGPLVRPSGSNSRSLVDFLDFSLSRIQRIRSISGPETELGYIEFVDYGGNIQRCQADADGTIWFGLPGQMVRIGGLVRRLRFTCYEADGMAVAADDFQNPQWIRTEISLVQTDGFGEITRHFSLGTWLDNAQELPTIQLLPSSNLPEVEGHPVF